VLPLVIAAQPQDGLPAAAGRAAPAAPAPHHVRDRRQPTVQIRRATPDARHHHHLQQATSLTIRSRQSNMPRKC
jgi:hypothetical protein